MTKQTHRPLLIGEVRQTGDQVRTRFGAHSAHWEHSEADMDSEWRPCTLLGHRILPIDLTNAELRRPL